MRARKPTSIGPEASPETAKRLGWTNFANFPIPSQYELFFAAFWIYFCMYIQKCEVWRRNCTACAANGQKPLAWLGYAKPGLISKLPNKLRPQFYVISLNVFPFYTFVSVRAQ